MNLGQKQFYDFIVARVGDEYVEAAKDLLNDNFRKQDEGLFTTDDILDTQEALLPMIKPEAMNEVGTAMALFASKIQ